MDTTNIPAVIPQSGVVLSSYGPNCLILDKPLDISSEQIARGTDLTLTLPVGVTVTRRIETIFTTPVKPAAATDQAVVALVTFVPGFSFAPHPETPWAISSTATTDAE